MITKCVYGKPFPIKIVRRLLPLVLIISLLLTSCVVPDSKGADSTLMIYMSGSNLESRYGLATRDLEEIVDNYPTDSNINILLMASGSSSWKNEIDPDRTNIYKITDDGLELVDSNGLMNMGDSDTLQYFLDYCYDEYPAEEYELLLWDHGGGPMLGVCFDELHLVNNAMDSLSLNELGRALEKSPFSENKLEWIGFDACMMASLETAITVEPYAEYMIASEELEASDGWDYTFISELGSVEDGYELGRKIIDSYAEFYKDNENDVVTLSLLDLSKVGELNSSVSEMFSEVTPNAENYAELCKMRQMSSEVARYSTVKYDLVDLTSLANNISGFANAESVVSDLEDVILYSYSSDKSLKGMSIYYPFGNWEKYITPWSVYMNDSDGADGYKEYIGKISKLYSDERISMFQSIYSIETTCTDSNRIIAKVPIEIASNCSEIKMIVLEKKYSNSFYKIYEDTNIKLDKVDQIECYYDNNALFFVDENNKIQTDSVEYYRISSDYIAVPIVAYNLSDDSSSYRSDYLFVYKEYDDGTLELLRIFPADDSGQLIGKESLKEIPGWDVYQIASFGSMPKYNSDNKLLPYNEWESAGELRGVELVNEKLGHPVFLNSTDGYDRYVYFEITDYQDNVYCTEFFSLDNPNSINIKYEGNNTWDEGELSFCIDDVSLRFFRDTEKSKVLNIDCVSNIKSEDNYSISILANGKPIDIYGNGNTTYYINEKKSIYIPLSVLIDSGVEKLSELTIKIYHSENDGTLKEVGEIQLSMEIAIDMF